MLTANSPSSGPFAGQFVPAAGSGTTFMPDFGLSAYAPSLIVIDAATALVAGGPRGFSGFRDGLVLMPVASALIGPRLAAPSCLPATFRNL
ncbi:MAG TPA: hypothetical protein VMW31_03740 [Devosiaceae bacterium]|nr:hypothetical protein [Devosiaceae bacterium]